MAREIIVNSNSESPAQEITARLMNVAYPCGGGAGSLYTTGGTVTKQPEDAPNKITNIIGTLTSNATLILTRDAGSPLVFAIRNSTSGAYTLTIKVTAGGTGVAITAGATFWLVTFDGINLIDITPSGGGGGSVSSVFGRTGAVVAATNDYTWAQLDKATSSLADITTRSAGDLSSGTLPDARFPATLPAVSGANLTALNGSNVATGTVALARLPGSLLTETNVKDVTNKNLISPSVEGSILFETGVRQTFAPSTTVAGLNVGVVASDPTTPEDGDLWYETSNKLLRARINGANVSLGAAGGGGADTALSNLASVAINASLLPATDIAIDLGSAAKRWRRSYFGAGSSTDAAVQIGDVGFYLIGSGQLGVTYGSTRYANWTYDTLHIERDDGKFRVGQLGGGNEVDWTADGSGNAKITVSTGKGFVLPGSLRLLGRTSSSGAASTTELPTDKDLAIHKNTTSGVVVLAYNDAGTIKSIALA